MATFLHRIGRAAFQRRRLVLFLWVLVLGAMGAAAANSSGGASSAFTLPGTEAQRANDLLGDKFPAANAEGATARVVLRAPDGEKITGSRYRAEATATLKDLKGSSSRVASVSDPFTGGAVSKDGTTVYAQVVYRAAPADLTDRDHERFDAALADGRGTGLTVEASGSALAPAKSGSSAEAIGFALAAVILLLTLGSLVAAGLPLLTAVLGVGVSASAITALSAVFDLNSSTSALATMLGIAVGIDYALFIVSRYRAERAAGFDAREAAGRANGTAGSAVVFAGLTVMIALVGLAVVDLPVLTAMGIAAAGAVAIAVLIAITLVPALLGFAPERSRGRARDRAVAATAAGARDTADSHTDRTGRTGKAALGERWAALILRRPARVLLAAAAALIVIALPATKLELGLPDDSTQPTSTTQRKAYDMLSASFGAGFNGPLTVVVTDEDAATARKAAAELRATIGTFDDVAVVAPAVFNPAGDTAILSVIPRSAPSSDATKDLVGDIRALAAETHRTTGVQGMVTGTTALNIDVSDKFSAALVPYLLVVVGLAVLVLTLVFRSVLVPVKAALGFLLSVLASLGAVVAVFQWGWLKGLFGIEQTGPIMSLMPILTVGIVFGLAMDYQVFLVTRIREAYVHGADPRRAVTLGFRHSAKVITAAAVIMICVFAGFIGSTEPVIKALGFGLAVAVAFDAFLVRMTIVPAALALLGRRAWSLPGWLDRALPDVDIEGEKLTARAPDLPQQAAPARDFSGHP
ncbi:MMPL family transporter [Streptomyces sp. RY43-2]|uniref:MMPL family transporter n=1 Tax=Streptomyces macrolidinus TaxID=2952607 RepID=A0ABT0ZM79_9ACTN|nr:MMPL family transporter [Streptomyces macrolidinus]MCN9244694.1 MMPL family transporter [Streptomyces macrolidinus]